MSGADREEMTPGERLFRDDVERGARFLAGVAAKQWRLVALDWPHAVIAISVMRGDVKRELALRFKLDEYRSQPPTAMPWDVEGNSVLAPENWPRGSEALSRAFNPNWRGEDQQFALYIPFDRLALPGHNWISTHPEYSWGPECDITTYLKYVRRLLDDDGIFAADQAA